MIPFPSGMFNGGYDPFFDSGWLFGLSMYRAQDWDIVNTNQLRLRDFKTGNFSYSSTLLRREDQGGVRCWIPASSALGLGVSAANASWWPQMQACASGVSIVVAGYSKVAENVLTADGSDLGCRLGINFSYKVASAGGASRRWWDSIRTPPYESTNQFSKLQFYTLADSESGVGYYHDSVPGCITNPANSGTIIAPGYNSGDFVMIVWSLTSAGPKMHFNTTQLTSYSSGGANGTAADVRPAAFHSTNTEGAQIYCNASMRTMFAGIYNEPLSANPAKLAEIYNALKNQ